MNAARDPHLIPSADALDYVASAPAVHEQIIGSFCHDLRQPLNAALMRLAALKRAYVNGHDQDLLEELHLSLREISNMSETVFDAIRLSRASITPKSGAFSIDEILERVRVDFGPLAAQKGLRLVVRGASYLAVTDETLVARIVSNLVHNALHYTRSGGILVAVRRRRGQFCLEVWDTGPGIAEDDLEDIFSPFVRGSGEHHEQASAPNCGIGLWNGREFARLLGGTLRAYSRLGRGTVFRLELPIEVEPLSRTSRLAGRALSVESRCVALLASDPDALLAQQRLVLERGLTHMSFTDPLQLLAYLNVPLNRPRILLVDLLIGPIEVDFLLKIVLTRYRDQRVAVLADDVSHPKSQSVLKLGVPVVDKSLTPGFLDQVSNGVLIEPRHVALQQDPAAEVLDEASVDKVPAAPTPERRRQSRQARSAG